MAIIHVLDNNTIDKIAAGEVVERPASVVKELVENAMDAGAGSITVEIKEGGIEFIRVTDDGCGIDKAQVKNAFLRHATSKINNVSDLMSLKSMGFRGEALSSIAAVSKVEIITKTKDELTGIRLCLDGGNETDFEEVGAPDGTTFIVRNLFFNTPVRRKFLKTAMTEGSYITDMLEHMALSRPEISFKYVINGQTKFFTNGDGDLKAIIYRIFGRDISNEMIEFKVKDENIDISGYLGKPILNRANRNFENYFVNNRYIKSKIISKAIEEGYQSYMMQHRYPFCVLHINVPSDSIDVNVHPTKMEIRFSNQNTVYKLIADSISGFLARQEMIPESTIGQDSKNKKAEAARISAPEPFEKLRKDETIEAKNNIIYENKEKAPYVSSYDHKGEASVHEQVGQFLFDNKVAYNRQELGKRPFDNADDSEDDFFVDERKNRADINKTSDIKKSDIKKSDNAIKAMETDVQGNSPIANKIIGNPRFSEPSNQGIIKAKDHIIVEKPEQLNFFDEKILTKEASMEFKMIGQVFDTYWIIEYKDKMLMIDQHAAHEKVKYEQILKKVEQNQVYTQVLTPPIIISVTPKEADLINTYTKYFEELGFQIEDFGMNAYAIRGVPMDLFSFNIKELFEEILTQIAESPMKGVPQIIKEKIASIACKAAVKGNNKLSVEEAGKLIEQLLELDNPYNCPHGRPTIIQMSKYEIEKKFKRIV
ncbi:MAG: DNA mismatch repair endonuclease MutL [Lachnospiraceae bacterium]|nr:DNA mismatch repair endonuclease MutL [Lachnospiraceae bacterium]